LKTWWRDDSQVVDGRTMKVYAERTGHPRVMVRVRTWNPDTAEQAKTLLEGE